MTDALLMTDLHEVDDAEGLGHVVVAGGALGQLPGIEAGVGEGHTSPQRRVRRLLRVPERLQTTFRMR
jgi:hypothetical protein